MKLPGRRILQVFMVLVFLAAGFLLIFTDVFIDTVHRAREAFGSICIIYGVFRGIVVWRRIKKDRENAGQKSSNAS